MEQKSGRLFGMGPDRARLGPGLSEAESNKNEYIALVSVVFWFLMPFPEIFTTLQNAELAGRDGNGRAECHPIALELYAMVSFPFNKLKMSRQK